MAVASVPMSFQERNEQVVSLIREAVKPLPSADKNSDIALICKDYLFSFVFPSIRSFVRYCQLNDVIELPAGEALRVYGASLIFDNREEELHPEVVSIKMICLFNEVISPLGKTFLVTQYGWDGSFYIPPSEKSHAIANSSDTIWTVGDYPVQLRLSSLLRGMAHSSISRVVFKNPVTFWGLKKSECQELESGQMLEASAWMKQRLNPAISRISSFYTEVQAQHYENIHFGASYPKGIEISIELKRSLSSVQEFIEQMTFFGSIYLPPFQRFEVRDLQIESFRTAYNKYKTKNSTDCLFFVFNSMVLHLGKCIWIKAFVNRPSTYYYEIHPDKVWILANEALEVQLVIANLEATLEMLGRAMMRNGCPRLSLNPGQRLLLRDVSTEGGALSRQRLPGVMWGPFETTKKEGQVICHFSLKKAPAKTFIADVLRCSPRSLGLDLRKGDSEAFVFLCFQVAKVYCFDGFHFFSKVEGSEIFNQETQQKMLELWKNQEFAAAREVILQDRILLDLVQKICEEASSEDFDKLDMRWLSQPVAIVFRKLKEVAGEMVQGKSVFLDSLTEYLRSQQAAPSKDQKEGKA